MDEGFSSILNPASKSEISIFPWTPWYLNFSLKTEDEPPQAKNLKFWNFYFRIWHFFDQNTWSISIMGRRRRKIYKQ